MNKMLTFVWSIRFRLIFLTVMVLLPALVAMFYLAETVVLYQALLIVGSFCLLSLGGTWFFGEYFIRRQVYQLIEATKKLQQEKFDEVEKTVPTKAEFGELGKAFIAMSATLKERTKKLKTALFKLGSVQKKMMEQERIRALGQMASGIAHDFNNTLTPILGYSELILAQPYLLEDGKKTLGYIQAINTAAKDAEQVVKRLREFYREKNENEELALVDLNAIARETVRMTQPKWGSQALSKKVQIQVELKLEEVGNIYGNDSEIRESLTNLIFNAVDAMPQGGTITLSTYEKDSNVVLAVTDTGVGMSKEIQRRCFEPFFTSKGKAGTGLGLSAVYGMIHRHNGQIELVSEVGKGSTFMLKFPCKTAVLNQHLRILLIEDEYLVRHVIKEYLRKDGHAIMSSDNPEKAMEKIKNHRFDLVISDGGMPGLDGKRITDMIKQRDPEVPVILLSGYADYLKLKQDSQTKADLILSKPITINGLRDGIHSVFAKEILKAA